MKKLCCLMALAVLAGIGPGEASAQPAPGEIVEYPDTSLTACPTQHEVLSHFYYVVDSPFYRGATWCGAAQAVTNYWSETGPLRPYILEECTAGHHWRFSTACSTTTFCDGSGRDHHWPPMRGITMVCIGVAPPPEPPLDPGNPPLGCITGSGGFSRCLRDEGVLPSGTPPGTPAVGGLNPNAGSPGNDDSHAEAPPQVLPDAGANQGSCTRAEAVGNPIFAGTGNKFQEEVVA